MSRAPADVVSGYAIGAATGDFDNDGCVDMRDEPRTKPVVP
jgi:hypothetical protein